MITFSNVNNTGLGNFICIWYKYEVYSGRRFADTRVESFIICDKLYKSKNEVNDSNKLQPRLLDTVVLKSAST